MSIISDNTNFYEKVLSRKSNFFEYCCDKFNKSNLNEKIAFVAKSFFSIGAYLLYRVRSDYKTYSQEFGTFPSNEVVIEAENSGNTGLFSENPVSIRNMENWAKIVVEKNGYVYLKLSDNVRSDLQSQIDPNMENIPVPRGLADQGFHITVVGNYEKITTDKKQALQDLAGRIVLLDAVLGLKSFTQSMVDTCVVLQVKSKEIEGIRAHLDLPEKQTTRAGANIEFHASVGRV